MFIHKASVKDMEKWNSFVEKEGGSFFHYFEWNTIYQLKKWNYIPLMIENETGIIGILPLVRIKGYVYSKLVSLPEGASGGFVFNKNLGETEKFQAIKITLEYLDNKYSKSCSSITINENLTIQDASRIEPSEIFIDNGYSFQFDKNKKLPCTYLLKLTPSFEESIWNGHWGKYLRNHIRKSTRKGVVVKEDTQFQFKDDIYRLLSTTYRRFHSRPLSKKEIILRYTTFQDKTKVWIAFLNDQPIASLLCYYNSTTCYASKIGYMNSARNNYATVLLYYEAIRDASSHHYQFFEFGLTQTPSLAYWKEQFKPIKIPVRAYEKRYSLIKTCFEKHPVKILWVLNNKGYIWKNRHRLIMQILGEKT